MNIHKEKCKRLKAIRKKLADGLGIDLKQRECTFEGECRGTCPKCRQEEEALNRALLGKAAAVVVSAGMLLTGCQGESEIHELDGDIGPGYDESETIIELEGDIDLGYDESETIDELDGDIAPGYDESKTMDEIAGGIELWYDEGETIGELDGDIALEYNESVPVYENEE